MNKPKTTEIYAPVQLDLDDVVRVIVDDLDHDELLDFILTLDNRVADYDFTATLVKRLQDALKAEDEAAQSEGGA